VASTVFFNIFFEAEPFAAILIAHGTHAPKCSVKWLHYEMCVIVTNLCLAFSDDIELDFVLMTSAYSCKQYLALIAS